MRSANRTVEEANALFRAGKAEEALALYDRVSETLPGDSALHFNRGAALFQLSRIDEASQAFLRATETKDPRLKAAAFYNLGNSLLEADKVAEAVEAYKRSLALDPKDMRAKWNLEIALRKKAEKQKQDQDKQDREKQDQKKQDGQKDPHKQNASDGKDQENRQQGKEPETGTQRDAKDKEREEPKGQGEKPPPAPGPPERPQPENAAPQPGKKEETETLVDRAQMDAVLDALEGNPKDLAVKRARIRAVRRAPPAKDW